MQPPTTSEEKDRRENASNKVNLVTDVMATLSDIEDPISKLKILKSLLSNAITNVEVIDLLQKEIDRLEADVEAKAENIVTDNSINDSGDFDASSSADNGEADFDMSPDDVFGSGGSLNAEESSSNSDGENDNYLPSPEDLGVDMTQNI